METWELDIVQWLQEMKCNNNMVVIVELHSMFCFHLKELGQLKGHEMKIILEDDKFIFR
jgi:hypothetical protein